MTQVAKPTASRKPPTRSRATARVAKPLTVRQAQRQLERAHEEYQAGKASTEEAMVTLWEKRQAAEDALRRAKGLPTHAEECKAKREAEERAKAEAAKGRSVDLRELGGLVTSLRDELTDAGAFLHAVDLGLFVGGTRVTGRDEVMVNHGHEASRQLRACVTRLAWVVELVASEIGMKVDPGETDARLDCLEFPSKRSGVRYGDASAEGGAS